MVKKNYKAWHVNTTSVSDDLSAGEKLKLFAQYAILSPSGHNSQPWRLSLKQDVLELWLNKDHHLSSDGSGLLSVEPYVSLGTFIETFILAAEGFGYHLDLKIHLEGSRIATFRISDKRDHSRPELLEAITKRVSNRSPFKRSTISASVLSKILKNNLGNVEIIRITKRADISYIAEQTEIATDSIMSKAHYRRELSEWVRTNFTRRFDGMPGFTHGFGGLKSIVSKSAVRHAPKHGPQARKSRHLIQESGALILVACAENTKLSFLNAGRAYSRMAVFATHAGLASSALGAAVVDPVTRESVKRRFHIQGRPVYILRIGAPTVHARHSPRWPIEKLGLK